MTCQAVVLVLTARLLGVENYGVMVALVSISLLLGPWSGLGFDFVALRAVARDREASSSCFWQGTRLVGLTATPMIIVTVVVTVAIFAEHDWLGAFVLILVAELFCLRITELIAKIFQGSDRYHDMAIVRLMISVCRLAVLTPVAVLYSSLTLWQWGWANVIAAVLALAFGVAYLRLRIGLAAPRTFGQQHDIPDGLHFAAGITSTRLGSEFDKALVLGFAGAASAGVYGAAYRLVSLAVVPIISFVSIIITSLFKLQGDERRRHLSERSLGLCGVAAVYGAVVGGFIWLFLPDVAAIALGEDFRAVSAGLAPLALLPVFMSCRLVAEQAMAALEQLRIRTVMQWSVAIVAVVANVVAIPRFGWTAAVWVLLVSETVLSLGYLAVILSSGNSSRESAA